MNRLSALFMLLVLGLPSMFKIWIWADWKANQDYIAEVFCVNKDKPDMACNGQCHLDKQLAKADAPDSESRHKLLISVYDSFVYIGSFLGFVFVSYYMSEAIDFDFIMFDFAYFFEWTHDVFHPPKI